MKNTNAQLVAADALPWQPVSAGFSLKVLHADLEEDRRTLLLRLEPGTVIERHRHSGEVHAYNLQGQRKLLDGGEIVGPGGYVYEPPGNLDSWMAVGDEPVVVFVTVHGAIETLDERGNVVARNDTRSVWQDYARFVATQRPV